MKKRRKNDAEIKREVAAFLGGDVALYWPGGAGGGGSRKRLKGGSPVVRPHARTSASCRWCGHFHTTAEHERETRDHGNTSRSPSRPSRSRRKEPRAAKVTPPAQRQPPRPGPPARSPLEVVREAITQVKAPGRFGDRKVFISALWRRVGPKLGMSIDEFKQWLLVQHRASALTLARADLVAAMDPVLVADSEIHDRWADFHFVLDAEVKDRW